MRILIAEDDLISRRLLEAKLIKWGYDVVAASDGDAAWMALTVPDAPRIAILDWMMPGADGVELCRRVRKALPEPYTYIILLTAQQRDEDLIIGMDAGADDYITKPFKANELKVRLRAGKRIIELQNELIEAREALREKATHDPLTGLWNHEEIILILEHELSRAKREGGHVTAIMADLDYFKKINDTYGHMAGDEVLQVAAQRILTETRCYDSVGRIGGEEFLIVLPGCKKEDVAANAERIRLSISAGSMNVCDELIQVNISVGAATNVNGKKCDVHSLIKAADLALYQAKKNGRNRVEIALDEDVEAICDS
jgi:two-component system, cell cycle response regulator